MIIRLNGKWEAERIAGILTSFAADNVENPGWSRWCMDAAIRIMRQVYAAKGERKRKICAKSSTNFS